MRILLFGATGQLGSSLREVLSHELLCPTRGEVDLSQPDQIRPCLDCYEPELVINAAAYNLVDQAETDSEAAELLNCEAPGRMALYCETQQIPLVHVSTDYVFGGSYPERVPHTEEAPPTPTSAYALSKLHGEEKVRANCTRHFILRTCGLFGPTKEPGRGNFVETMLRLGNERGEVSVVNDQTCTPTGTADLARAISRLIQTDAWGLYHCTNSGETSWYEFAREIFQQANIQVNVTPITTEAFGAPAPRPSYSVLNCEKIQTVINRDLPPWQHALEEYLLTRTL